MCRHRKYDGYFGQPLVSLTLPIFLSSRFAYDAARKAQFSRSPLSKHFEYIPKGEVVRKTTLAAIAAEAGVSLPTVSKVVNGRPDVAPDTRARVEQLLDRHNY